MSSPILGGIITIFARGVQIAGYCAKMTNSMAASIPSEARYYCVFSDYLDKRKNWYAYNVSLDGYSKSNWKHEEKSIFKCLPDEVKKVRIEYLQDSRGNPASYRMFYGGAQRSEYVHVMSGFGVLALALRQRNINKDSFTSEVFQQIVITVNTIPLEETGAKFNTEITKRDNNIGPAEALLDRPALMFSNLSLSIADILRSNEISPPDKKRRIKDKGKIIAKSLKNVADAHREDILTVLGDIASEDLQSDASDILVGATDVVFQRLGAKKALDVVLLEESRSALITSIRMPDWVYLLLKIRMRISDFGWQTLLNLTQLGRTGVSNILFYVYDLSIMNNPWTWELHCNY